MACIKNARTKNDDFNKYYKNITKFIIRLDSRVSIRFQNAVTLLFINTENIQK